MPARRRAPSLPPAIRAEIAAARQARRREELTYQGIHFDSIWEVRHARNLDLQQAAGIITQWRYKIPFSFDIDGRPLKIGNRRVYHYVDFQVTYADGRVELHEVKGRELPVWKLKRALLEVTFLAAHPEVTYRVLYEEDL